MPVFFQLLIRDLIRTQSDASIYYQLNILSVITILSRVAYQSSILQLNMENGQLNMENDNMNVKDVNLEILS
jgi:hypothetical protein